MKKIAVMSDNHGDDSHIERILQLEKDADAFVHCGDSETYQENLLRRFYAVGGNNDWGLRLPREIIFELGGHRIFVTHGQRLGYFHREQILAEMARENNCDLVLCGHTHMPMWEEVDGITVVNPGSTRLPRGGSLPMYARVYLDGRRITVDFVEFT